LLLLQLPFVIVHLNITFVPAVRPETALVGELGELIVTAVPLTMLHEPVSRAPGVLPARMKLGVSHFPWSGPASATVAGI
jgi:hypothetical protein